MSERRIPHQQHILTVLVRTHNVRVHVGGLREGGDGTDRAWNHQHGREEKEEEWREGETKKMESKRGTGEVREEKTTCESMPC